MSNLVIGASVKTFRYSNMAINRLLEHGHEVKAIGLRAGDVKGVEIETGMPAYKGIDTVLLYVNPGLQKDYYDYIKSLKPRRVLFAPGTENPEFEEDLKSNGIDAIEACSLVMLSTGQY